MVLTGVASDALGREALKAGAQDYLVKGQHDFEAVGRSVVFAMERAQRQDAEQQQALLADRLHLLLELRPRASAGSTATGPAPS